MRSMTTLAFSVIAACAFSACASGGGGSEAAAPGASGPSGAARGGFAFGPAVAAVQPAVTISGQDIELTQAGHVVVLEARVPQADDGRPVLFQVEYPRYDTDQLEFQPGRHRLTSRQRTASAPPRCPPGQAASLKGCRPYLNAYPGVGGVPNLADYYAPGGYVMIVAPTFTDPYELADMLMSRARNRPALAAAFKSANGPNVQLELTSAFANMGSGWAAFYRPPR